MFFKYDFFRVVIAQLSVRNESKRVNKNSLKIIKNKKNQFLINSLEEISEKIKSLNMIKFWTSSFGISSSKTQQMKNQLLQAYYT